MNQRNVILLLAFLLMTTAASAQISLGLKAGYNRAWEFYNTELPENAEIDIPAFHISSMVYLDLGNTFSIGLEPGFVRRGAACVPGWEPIWGGDTRWDLNYLEAPLMVSARLPLGNKFELYGKAGYGVGYLMSGKVSFPDPWQAPTPEGDPAIQAETMVLDFINRLDHGIYGGLGLGMQFGPGQIILESEYYHGLRDVDQFNHSRNRSVDVGVGYRFRL